MSQDPFEKFRYLLEQNYQFPAVYLHKFIGKNSALFLESVQQFEKKFIGLTKTNERQSASGEHISLTYEYQAANAEDVVELTIQTQQINDIIYIL
jgi:putative lipoic acid-binding regulatory protein